MTTVNAQDSYQASYRAGTIAMTTLGVPFIILRFLARWKKSLKPGLNYYMIMAALLPFLALVVTNYGMGLRSQILPIENIAMIAKLLVVFECTYVTTIAITKISILLMYCRIFPTKEIRIASMILGGISFAWAIAIIFVSIFQCTPITRAWDTRILGTCINLKASFIGNAVPNIVTDILILSRPVRVVWRLHASLTHRLSVIGIFLLGNIAGTLGKSCTWCVVESSTGIISACMPTLRPLLLVISSKFSSQSSTQRTRTTDVENSKGYELDNSAL
ncbi:hypothetical protein N7445_008076 [Penicillium cf. griseofulvum]|nr:hypothetical protein N7445_008076 [Penicillium cf. griseofulvum]